MQKPLPPTRSEADPYKTTPPETPQPETSGHLETVSITGGANSLSQAANTLPSFIGRYRVERILGEGGFGRVYLAHDDELKRSVAIKVPNRRMVAQPEHAEIYRAEARALASLDHPNIVPVHDVGRDDDGLPFVVSKFIEGQDLTKRMQGARLSFSAAAELIATIAEALHYAHGRGLVHRDIKPGNILIDAKEKPFVVDFGLALKEEDFGNSDRYAGTPAYMSPEQARGDGHRVDGRSDIFSLGVVFYELLTGRRPFTGQSVSEVLEQVASVEARPPRQIDDSIPKGLERICLKALSKRPTERYTTAKDMADDLRDFLPVTSEKVTADSALPGSSKPTDFRVRDSGNALEVNSNVVKFGAAIQNVGTRSDGRRQIRRAVVAACLLLVFGLGAVGWMTKDKIRSILWPESLLTQLLTDLKDEVPRDEAFLNEAFPKLQAAIKSGGDISGEKARVQELLEKKLQAMLDAAIRNSDKSQASAYLKVFEAIPQEFRSPELARQQQLALRMLPRSQEVRDVPQIVWKKRPSAKSTVFIGSQVKGGAVTILLDCSASMWERFESGERRYVVATRAISSILDGILKSEEADVSLWLFAHRRGYLPRTYFEGHPFAQDDIKKVPLSLSDLAWNRYFDEVAPVISPAEDASEVWKKGMELSKLRKLLGSGGPPDIQPMGYTPLYYAIKKVVDEQLSRAKDPRALVVITDGEDYVDPALGGETYNDSHARKERADAAILALEKASAGKTPVRLSIIDFAGRIDFDILRTEFFSKWKHTDVYESPSPQSLAKILENLAGTSNYQITELETGVKVAEGSSFDDDPIEIAQPGRYKVSLDNDATAFAYFEVRGGEQLLLHLLQEPSSKQELNESRIRIIHDRYLDGTDFQTAEEKPKIVPTLALAKELRPDFAPDLFSVSALTSEKPLESNQVVFRVAVTNQDVERFSPRPAEIWAEIIPCKAPIVSSPQPLQGSDLYYFMDPDFDVGEKYASVPVLKFVADKWPERANSALIKLWFRPLEHQLGGESVEIAKHLEKGAFSLPGDTENVTFRLQKGATSNSLMVIELHPPGTAGAAPAFRRVQVIGERPTMTKRKYFPELGRIEHEIVFEANYQNRSLRIQPLEEWKRGAFTTDKPLEVRLKPK